MGNSTLWFVGVFLEILSTMSGTVGKQLIRLAEITKPKNAALSKILFYTGLIVNTLMGPVLDMAAYSFAAQSLIAPFGGLDVVWNAMLAPYILDETLTTRRIVGCGLIVVGTSMAGGFGNHLDEDYTLEYLEETLVNIRVLAYLICFVLWFCFNRFYLMQFPPGSAIRGVSLGVTAGTIAGNMFCVKAAIELIQRSIEYQEGEIWLHWMPYLMLAGAAFFALTNVIFMTKGLTEYEALFMVTIYEGSMIVTGCVTGSVILLDLKRLPVWRVCLYWSSISLIVLGMYVVFSNEAAKQRDSELNSACVVPSRKYEGAALPSGAIAEISPPFSCPQSPSTSAQARQVTEESIPMPATMSSFEDPPIRDARTTGHSAALSTSLHSEQQQEQHYDQEVPLTTAASYIASSGSAGARTPQGPSLPQGSSSSQQPVDKDHETVPSARLYGNAVVSPVAEPSTYHSFSNVGGKSCKQRPGPPALDEAAEALLGAPPSTGLSPVQDGADYMQFTFSENRLTQSGASAWRSQSKTVAHEEAPEEDSARGHSNCSDEPPDHVGSAPTALLSAGTLQNLVLDGNIDTIHRERALTEDSSSAKPIRVKSGKFRKKRKTGTSVKSEVESEDTVSPSCGSPSCDEGKEAVI